MVVVLVLVETAADRMVMAVAYEASIDHNRRSVRLVVGVTWPPPGTRDLKHRLSHLVERV